MRSRRCRRRRPGAGPSGGHESGGGTRGRADGSERAVPWLFLMFSLTRCRCLPISSDLIIFLSFSCCSSWCPTSAGEPWKDWKPSGTSRTGRWVCSQWAAQGPVISQGAAAKRGSVAAIRGLYWAGAASSRCHCCSAERELASPSPPHQGFLQSVSRPSSGSDASAAIGHLRRRSSSHHHGGAGCAVQAAPPRKTVAGELLRGAISRPLPSPGHHHGGAGCCPRTPARLPQRPDGTSAAMRRRSSRTLPCCLM